MLKKVDVVVAAEGGSLTPGDILANKFTSVQDITVLPQDRQKIVFVCDVAHLETVLAQIVASSLCDCQLHPLKCDELGIANSFEASFGECRSVQAKPMEVKVKINLNTTSLRKATSVAFDVDQLGRTAREGGTSTGKILVNEKGEQIRIPGSLSHVRAVGVFDEKHDIAQVLLTLMDYRTTSLHAAFEELCKKAEERGLRVTGCEIIGWIPKEVIMAAGKHFLRKQKRSSGIPEKDILNIAIRSLGLNDTAKFEPSKQIIEYYVEQQDTTRKFVDFSLKSFADSLSSESVAPGGGSASSYVAVLGASLGTMVANVSSNKLGWEEKWEEFSVWAEKGQALKDELMLLVDEDCKAYHAVLQAMKLPSMDEEGKPSSKKGEAIEAAMKGAVEVPLTVMQLSLEVLELVAEMTKVGIQSSIGDAGVGGICAKAAIESAFLNIRINASSIKDKDFSTKAIERATFLRDTAVEMEKTMMDILLSRMKS